MASRIHPGALGVTIFCFVLTIAFVAGAYSKASDLAVLRDGDPAKPNADTVPKLLEQRTALRREIAALESDFRVRRQELERADIELSRNLVHWQQRELLGGIATPGRETAVIRGESQRLKRHRFEQARFSIEEISKRLDAWRNEYQSAERQSFPQLDQAIAARNRELSEVNQRIADQDAQFQRERSALLERLDQLKAEKDKLEKTQAAERSSRLTRIAQLEDRIRKLLGREFKWLTELTPVGQIVAVEPRSNRAIIDLGARDRVFPGLLFEVFTVDKGGYVEKGMLEVIEVQADISVCRIISQKDPKRLPLAKDDRIGNPVFDPRRPRVFVIAGEFERFDPPELASFIRRAGGIVVDKIGPGVDFLVAGARSEREQTQAREYILLGMTEQQLLKYVQPHFVPQAGGRR
ncbi:MAG: hypothetical protein N3B15_02180 [Planctomycetota bacterium]|nr:hypothetical protein [Planctomycetota bacterium]